MATIRDTDRRRGRGFFIAALAAFGVLAVTAGDGVAQAFRGYGFEPAAYQGRNWERMPGRLGYGRPGPNAYGAAPPGFNAPGRFRRGQVLPQDQRDRYVDDPGRYHLRSPPNGYGWVGDGRNAYLMQRSTGMVLDSVPGAYEPAPRFERGGRGGGGGQPRMENRGGGRGGGGRGDGGRSEGGGRGGGGGGWGRR